MIRSFKPSYVFAACAILASLLCYQLAFKKTIASWQLNRQLKLQLTQSADTKVQPQYQERKNVNLEQIICRYRADSTDFRGKVLSDIAGIAEKYKVKLSEVPGRDPLYRSGPVITQRLNIEGDYFALVKTIDQLQDTPGIGMIRSADLKTVTGFLAKGKTRKLSTILYFEIYHK